MPLTPSGTGAPLPAAEASCSATVRASSFVKIASFPMATPLLFIPIS